MSIAMVGETLLKVGRSLAFGRFDTGRKSILKLTFGVEHSGIA